MDIFKFGKIKKERLRNEKKGKGKKDEGGKKLQKEG